MSLNLKSELYKHQSDARSDYAQLLKPLRSFIADELNKYEVYPVSKLPKLIREIEKRVNILFIGVRSTGEPYSPFAVMLYSHFKALQNDLVSAHRDFIRDHVDRGVAGWLEGNSDGGFDPVHRWENEKNRDLNERIIAVAVIFMQKLGRFLTGSVVEGITTRGIMNDLDRLLSTTRRSPLSTRLQGLDLAYEPSRLIRNEVTRVYTDAVITLGVVNTLSEGIEWALSIKHPHQDICDALATVGRGGERLRPPYPVDTAPQVVTDSHVSCLCANYNSNLVNLDEVNRLNALHKSGSPAPVNPFSSGFYP